MYRKMYGVAVLGLLFCASAVLADEVKGKLAKVDDAGSKITMKVDGKETEYAVDKDCKMPMHKGKDGKEKASTLKGLHSMVEKARSGVEATVITTKKGDKEVVTEIKEVHYTDAPKKKDKDK